MRVSCAPNLLDVAKRVTDLAELRDELRVTYKDFNTDPDPPRATPRSASTGRRRNGGQDHQQRARRRRRRRGVRTARPPVLRRHCSSRRWTCEFTPQTSGASGRSPAGSAGRAGSRVPQGRPTRVEVGEGDHALVDNQTLDGGQPMSVVRRAVVGIARGRGAFDLSGQRRRPFGPGEHTALV